MADPYVPQRAGSMTVNLDTARLWLRHVATLWDEGRVPEAGLAGSKARHVIAHLAEETVHHCIRACGARSLVRPSPVERILRDLTFYQRHDNDDYILAAIGRLRSARTTTRPSTNPEPRVPSPQTRSRKRLRRPS